MGFIAPVRPEHAQSGLPATRRPGDRRPGPSSRATDQRLLRLLGKHRVLTTGQLIQLAGIPERTAQYRFGVLYRAGLVVDRHRPRAAIGTAPYHLWLTPFGAAAAGVETLEPWGDDLTGVQTLAATNDLWLGLRDGGPAVGLTLTDWHPLPAGLANRDLRPDPSGASVPRPNPNRRRFNQAVFTRVVGATGLEPVTSAV
jgi:hypothetical protein